MINHNVSTIMMQPLTNCHYNEIPITKFCTLERLR